MKYKYRIKNKERQLLGIVDLEGSSYQLSSDADPRLVATLEECYQKGVDAKRCVSDGQDHLLLVGHVFKGEPAFPLFVIKYLEKQGYFIEEMHLEVDKAIAEAVMASDNDEATKHKLLSDLESLSYLEKTAILELEAVKKTKLTT